MSVDTNPAGWAPEPSERTHQTTDAQPTSASNPAPEHTAPARLDWLESGYVSPTTQAPQPQTPKEQQ